MNGLALQAYLQGERLANEDWRTDQRFPRDMLALDLNNQGKGLQNSRYAQETPLHLQGMQLSNEGKSLSNQGQSLQNSRYSQETPLHVQGMQLNNQSQGLQNSRYQQLTPLEVQQQQLANYGNQQINQKRAYDLQSTAQMQPTENALALQQKTQQLAGNAINQGIQAYRTTGNIGHLKQAIDGAYGGNVQIQPLPDGSVQVQDVDGVQKFASMDEFIGVVGNIPSATTATATGRNMINVGDGWLYDTATGTPIQVRPSTTTANMPMKDADIADQSREFVNNRGLDMPSSDRSLLALDVQARAKALMGQGVDPSTAMQQAYDSVSGGVSPDSWTGWVPFVSPQRYNPQGSAMPQANPLALGAQAQPTSGQLPANIPPELKAEAEAAIARGADPGEVMKQVRSFGF